MKGYIKYCDDGGSLVVVAHCYRGDLRSYLRLDHSYLFNEETGQGLSSKTQRQLINVGIVFLESVGVTEIETEQTFNGL